MQSDDDSQRIEQPTDDEWVTIEPTTDAAAEPAETPVDAEQAPPADAGWSAAPAAPAEAPPIPEIPPNEQAPPAPEYDTPNSTPTPAPPSAVKNALGAIGDALAGMGISNPQNQQLVAFVAAGLALLCGVCVCAMLALTLIGVPGV